MFENVGQALVFALRCAGACALGFGLAWSLGLPQPMWAAMSAVIVSQERFSDTSSSLASRIAGTALGAAISVFVGTLGAPLRAPTVLEMTVAVGLAALVAHRFPSLRVAMWTCPIVLMSVQASAPLVAVALRRASEVSLGAAVGWAFHWLAQTYAGAQRPARPG